MYLHPAPYLQWAEMPSLSRPRVGFQPGTVPPGGPTLLREPSSFALGKQRIKTCLCPMAWTSHGSIILLSALLKQAQKKKIISFFHQNVLLILNAARGMMVKILILCCFVFRGASELLLLITARQRWRRQQDICHGPESWRSGFEAVASDREVSGEKCGGLGISGRMMSSGPRGEPGRDGRRSTLSTGSSSRKLTWCKAFGNNKIQQVFTRATTESTLSILSPVPGSAVKHTKAYKTMFHHVGSAGRSQAPSGSRLSFLPH